MNLNMNTKPTIYSSAVVGLLLSGAAVGEDASIDASDPTKIYTFIGGGPKYSEFTDGEHIWEARVIGNVGLGAHDMILFEAGYGRINGNDELQSESDWTNTRIRWFHLFDMDYEAQGFRGMGTQVDMQLAGELPGTNGQNQLVTGLMPTWNFTSSLSLYLSLNLVNAWNKGFDEYNGLGVGFDAQFIFNADWWPGAQLRFVPVYTYFVDGELEDEGSGSFDINVGGEITPTIMWDVTAQKNFDKDLKSFRRGSEAEFENDWNIFLNVTSYF